MMRQSGFTLVEMLAVLAILALALGAVVMALRPPGDRLEITAATRKLCAALKHAHGRAIAGNADRFVTIDTRALTYQEGDAAPVALPPATRVRVTFASSERRATGEGVFRFHPNGEATGGEVSLERGPARGTIVVNWLTGDARCSG